MKKNEGKEELKFWHSIGTHNKEVLGELINSFNEVQKQTIVKGVFEGNDEDLYLKLLSRENLPDIVLIPVHLLPGLLRENLVVDLSSYIPQKTREEISIRYWESVTFEDRIYGIPFSFSSQIIYVNQNLLRIAGVRYTGEPSSWEKIFPILTKIQANTEGKWAIFIPMETTTQFISFIESYTGKLIYKDGALIVKDKKTIEAMSYLQQLVYSHSLMPPKATMSEGEQLFLSGKLGMMVAPSSMLVYTQSNLPYSLEVWHMPAAEGIKPLITGLSLALIKSNTKREKEAFVFLEYLLKPENILKWHTHTGDPAIRVDVKNSIDLMVFYEENPNYTTPVIDLERGRVFNPRVDYITLNKIIKMALERIMINQEEPANVLTDIQNQIDNLWLAAQSM
ncbi:MAG: extracellular solute-binding protein [Spirochaetota bacterium]